MPVRFLPNSDGLKQQHQGKPPLLEKVNCPPGTDQCQVMRVYPDGALYFQDRADPTALVWSYLTDVRQAGLASLRQTFNQLCSVDAAPERNANDQGSITYRWQTDKCGKEVVITGVSYGSYQPLSQVANIVNSNLVQRTEGQ